VIDTNAWLGCWPFRRLPLDEPVSLARRLRSLGIERAWVGHLDALFHEDIAAVNARLADQCERLGDGLFVPFGAVNPTLPDWQEDLRRCHEIHRMPGIRLHPDVHGYSTADPILAEALSAASARGLVVQVPLQMEDPRTRHARLDLVEVDPAPLVELVGEIPGLRLVLLNAGRFLGPAAGELFGASRLLVDIATVEGVGGVDRLIGALGVDRIVFGTHAPVFIPESAVLKLRESSPSPAALDAITRSNALGVLGAGGP
jgi:predicted TIM-barrel fold metal-dependent hydrolase